MKVQIVMGWVMSTEASLVSPVTEEITLDEHVKMNLLEEYERVILISLLQAFELDFLMKEQDDKVASMKDAAHNSIEISRLSNKVKLTEVERRKLQSLRNRERQETTKMRKKVEESNRDEKDFLMGRTKYSLHEDLLRSHMRTTISTSLALGVRQALGVILYEIWHAEKTRLTEAFQDGEPKTIEFYKVLIDGFVDGVKSAKERHKEVFEEFKEGAVAGFLTCVVTSVSNSFVSVSKRWVILFRHSIMTMVKACKVFFWDLGKSSLEERINAMLTILAIGMGTVVGVIVEQEAALVGLESLPGGEFLVEFIGMFIAGILSCTMIYFLDHLEVGSQIYRLIVGASPYASDLLYLRKIDAEIDEHLSRLLKIDLEHLQASRETFDETVKTLGDLEGEDTIRDFLLGEIQRLKISNPWGDCEDIDAFMGNKDNTLLFD